MIVLTRSSPNITTVNRLAVISVNHPQSFSEQTPSLPRRKSTEPRCYSTISGREFSHAYLIRLEAHGHLGVGNAGLHQKWVTLIRHPAKQMLGLIILPAFVWTYHHQHFLSCQLANMFPGLQGWKKLTLCNHAPIEESVIDRCNANHQ